MTEDPIEICLFWGNWQVQQWWSCVDKSLWEASSGWAQAFAAVVALGIAIWASGANERTEKRDAVVQARVFAKELVIWMQAIGYGLIKGAPGMVAISVETATELKNLAQSARYERLPSNAMESLINMRSILAALTLSAKSYLANPSKENADELDDLLRFYGPMVRDSSNVLHKKINSVAADDFDAVKAANLFIENADKVAAHKVKAKQANQSGLHP